ncbi:glycosyltransferase family 2 protein [bacterium]|nr:glycosyltransferase family 2 protein [bacterium]
MKLSVSIVTYNSEKTIQNCLVSLLKFSQKIEIFVVDNASEDKTVELVKKHFPGVKLLVNSKNLGFGKAQNLALRQVKGDFVLILNPDTVVKESVLDFLLNNAFAKESVGFVTPKLIFENGKIDLACKRSFPTPEIAFYRIFHFEKLFPKKTKFSNYNLNLLSENESYEVEAISGAFMLCKNTLLEKIGFFDESFFLYGEDLDLCLRAKEQGFRNFYFGNCEILHLKAVSSQKLTKLKPLWEFYRAMFLFYNKHYKEKFSFGVTLFVYFGIFFVFLLKLIFNPIRFLKKKYA